MVTLHIYLRPREGQEAVLEQLYHNTYVPAISKQAGFVGTSLLRSYANERTYEIDIVFESEELRQQWVSSPEHQQAWPQVKGVCETETHEGFNILER